MIQKLPLGAVYRLLDTGRLAMTVGYGVVGDEPFGTIALVEVEPDTWMMRAAEGLDLQMVVEAGQLVMADCVSKPGPEGARGFVLPSAVGGRQLTQHAVMERDGALHAYEDLDALRASLGTVVVGHSWELSQPGYERCKRCREVRPMRL